MSSVEYDIQAALKDFYADVAAEHLAPLWTQAATLMTAHPKPAARPWLWHWEHLSALARRAMELITISRGGDRRVLSLANPGLGAPFATATLWGAIQCLNAHESAPAHRHTPGAIRFVLEGSGVWTTVDGDANDMHPGDLILTPGWTWHDHFNGGDESMLWFDGLDLPMVAMLDAVFFEDDDTAPPAAHGPHNASLAAFGSPALLPIGTRPAEQSPLHIYPWSATDKALSALLAQQGGPLVSLEFVNPTTGRPALPTMGCEMHRVVPGGHSRPYRKVGSSIFVIYRGHGYSVINGTRFDWKRGDMLAVPSWATVEHCALEPSDIFAVTDRPVLETLGLFREEYLEQPQEITGHFEE